MAKSNEKLIHFAFKLNNSLVFILLHGILLHLSTTKKWNLEPYKE